MKSDYSISDLAKEFDITTRTIRFYEEIGLLSPKRKGSTRVFSSGDRVRLKLIVRGKRIGLSLEESREIIEMYEPNNKKNDRQIRCLLDKIGEKQEMLEQQKRDINLVLKDLKNIETVCRDALPESRGEKKVVNGRTSS